MRSFQIVVERERSRVRRDKSYLFSAAATTPVNKTASDTLTFTDAVTLAISNLVNLDEAPTDSISFTDTVTIFVGYALSFIDTISFSDDPGQIGAGINVQVADSILFLDDEGIPLGASVSDALTFTDMPIISGSLLRSLAPEILTLSDSANVILSDGAGGILLALSDSIVLSDSVAEQVVASLVLSDSLTLSDAVKLLGASVLTLNDVLTFVDSLNPYIPLSTILGDSFALSDFVALMLNSGPSGTATSDTMSLSDSVNVQMAINLIVHDSLAFVDTPNDPTLSEASLIVLSDSLSFTDSVTTLLSEGGTNNYLRRYLNDVIGPSNP